MTFSEAKYPKCLYAELCFVGVILLHRACCRTY